MKAITVFVIGALVSFSIAAAPAPAKVVLPKHVSGSFDGFSSLRSHRQGKGADVSWSFSSANTIGFSVQRTNEDPTDPYSVWVTVGTIGYNSSRSYKCHDENPNPGFINYRVTAVMNDQSTVTSPVTTVHIAAH